MRKVMISLEVTEEEAVVLAECLDVGAPFTGGEPAPDVADAIRAAIAAAYPDEPVSCVWLSADTLKLPRT